MIRHCIVHHIDQEKFFLLNLLTLDECVFKTKTNVLQSFFHVTDVTTADILLPIIVDSVAGGDDSDGFIKYILH